MALDKPKDSDNIIDEQGFKFIINEEISTNMTVLNIDYSDSWYRKGFRITSDIIMGGC